MDTKPDSLDIVLKFRNDEPELYKKALEKTENIRILANIYNNIEMFKVWKGLHDIPIYDNLKTAARDMESDQVIVYVEEFELYYLLNSRRFDGPFINRMSEYEIKVRSISSKFTIFQLVPTNAPQTPVFRCIADNYLTELIKHAEEYFKAVITCQKGEISVQLLCENDQSVYNCIKDFYQFVSNINKNHSNSIQYIIPQKIDGFEFKKLDITDVVLYQKNLNADRDGPCLKYMPAWICRSQHQKYMNTTPCISPVSIQSLHSGQYCIYFIGEVPFTDKVKIGKTVNLSRRIPELQTGNSNALDVFDTINVDTKEEMDNLETLLHHHLKDKRLIGEWFNLNRDEIYDIVKLAPSLLNSNIKRLTTTKKQPRK